MGKKGALWVEDVTISLRINTFVEYHKSVAKWRDLILCSILFYCFKSFYASYLS